MLKEIRVDNFALIDVLDLSLKPGFIVLTGETGSGKSILLGALELILGERADYSVIRNTEKKTIVEVIFDLKKFDLKHLFESHDLDFFEETVIRREIQSNGKSRAFINDTPVSLAVLKEISQNLIHIHSQHQTMELKSENFQLDFLDYMSENGRELKIEIKRIYKTWKSLLSKKNQIETQIQNLKKEEEFRKFQFEELSKLDLLSIDFQELSNELTRLEKSDEIKKVFSEVSSLISADQHSILTSVNAIIQKLNKLSFDDKKVTSWNERFATMKIELNDLSFEIDNYISTFDINHNELELLIEKNYHFQQALKKYNYSNQDELKAFYISLEQFSQNIDDLTQELSDLNIEISKQENILNDLSIKLTAKRKLVSEKVSIEIQNILSELKMLDTKILFKFSPKNDFSENGRDTVELLFAPNKGFDLKPIEKTASGGELSRVMLAIQSLLSKKKQLPTIIFDEIDTGVSGDVASKIGLLLKDLGENIQLIAITHLPQVAAKGSSHLKVWKEEMNDIIVTNVQSLNDEEKVIEVARLMSGSIVTDSAIENAKQLIVN